MDGPGVRGEESKSMTRGIQVSVLELGGIFQAVAGVDRAIRDEAGDQYGGAFQMQEWSRGHAVRLAAFF